MKRIVRPGLAVIAVGTTATIVTSSIGATGLTSLDVLAAAAIGAIAGAVTLWAVLAPRIDRVSDGLVASARRATGLAPDIDASTALRRLGDAARAAGASVDHAASAATTDQLTQIANRSALIAQLSLELERAKRHARPLSVAFIDIDRFKAVNDTYGHPAGDAVLRGVARTVSEAIRMTDTFGRYGGEEFLLVMPETDATKAAETAERLRQQIMRSRIALPDGRQLGVTVSIGVAGGRGRNLAVDALIRDADAAMYSAKTLGRNQVYVFEVPSEDGVVLRAPIDPVSRTLGRELGEAARSAAEHALTATLASLGEAARPGPYVVSAAVDMGRELGMSDSELEAMRVAAIFHDAGMVAVEDDILERPRALDQDAWHQVRSHPRVSHLMLEEASRLRDAAEIVLHHHERYAGHGYPHGLRGSEIPLAARVLAVADAYEGMREARPYRPAMTHEAAVAEILRHSGTQFDPHVAALFGRLYQDRQPAVAPPPLQASRPHRRVGRGSASARAARQTGAG